MKINQEDGNNTAFLPEYFALTYLGRWLSSVLCPHQTQHRSYGRRFLQVKRPNQQYQSTEGKSYKGKIRKRKQQNTHIHTQ